MADEAQHNPTTTGPTATTTTGPAETLAEVAMGAPQSAPRRRQARTGRAGQSGQTGQSAAAGDGEQWRRESGDMRDAGKIEATALDMLRDLLGKLDQLASRRDLEAVDKRVVALEEWRLSQTEQAAMRLMQIQEKVNANRTDIDGRFLQWFWAALMMAAGLLAGHLWK